MSLEKDWSSLSDIVHKAIRILEKRNVLLAEAFSTSTQMTEVTIRNSEILTQSKVNDSGVGFRVVVSKNRVGFACSNMLNEKAIMEVAEKALAIAKVSSEKPNFALPEASKPSKVRGLFDSRIEEVAIEEAVDIAKREITAAEDSDKRVIAKDGRVIFQSGWRGVINTLGVDLDEQETRAVIYLGGSGKQNDEVTGSCNDFMFTRTVDLEPETIGKNVAEMIIAQFEPKPLKSFEGTAIFGPEAVSYQIFDVLVDALKGENVIAQRSAWTKKLGETVASKNLTIADNAILEKGFASRGFDDEGCSSQNTTLITKGTLQSFLHDASSAKALKSSNTGNASRFSSGSDIASSIIGNGYRAKPEVYPSNLIIQHGEKKKEELVSETAKGVLIESMAGFSQTGSGMISAKLSRAFLIEKGEIKYPLKGGMVSGIAFDWFNKISGISKESKQFQNAVMPSLRLEGVKFVGA
jgi:PmbA protein